jgi:hypothetical protein
MTALGPGRQPLPLSRAPSFAAAGRGDNVAPHQAFPPAYVPGTFGWASEIDPALLATSATGDVWWASAAATAASALGSTAAGAGGDVGAGWACVAAVDMSGLRLAPGTEGAEAAAAGQGLSLEMVSFTVQVPGRFSRYYHQRVGKNYHICVFSQQPVSVSAFELAPGGISRTTLGMPLKWASPQ